MNNFLNASAATPNVQQAGNDNLLDTYQRVRQATLELTAPLETEDYALQAMPDVSPPKWHMAHTTWFFETFLLKPFDGNHCAFHPRFEYLFNSYYNAIGEQFPRADRGLLSRPNLKEVLAYRQHIDQAMLALLSDQNHPQRGEILARTELGLHHEQQHQELICTDIKYNFSRNPLYPSMNNDQLTMSASARELSMIEVGNQRLKIGHNGPSFHFDNEGPAHIVELPAFKLANRLVTNSEFLAFVNDGGYMQPTLWLSDGWAWKQENSAQHPLYWFQQEGVWMEYTLQGVTTLSPHHPVVHVNYYEADAYARWQQKRLPTEFEWEVACRQNHAKPSPAQKVKWHPTEDLARETNQTASEHTFSQWFGSAWQWTQSSYAPYPRYRPAKGAIGEYNGKFMCNQLVLRGSSCVTPPDHTRVSYRNFFYPQDQWQFSGIRLADDA